MSNHNPYLKPGYYNPSEQCKTEINDFVGLEGFIDPTQIPIIPGDTLRPVHDGKHPVESSQSNSIRGSVMESPAKYAFESKQPMPAIAVSPPLAEVYERSTIALDANIKPVVIPITIELTINLRINHSNG